MLLANTYLLTYQPHSLINLDSVKFIEDRNKTLVSFISGVAGFNVREQKNSVCSCLLLQ